MEFKGEHDHVHLMLSLPPKLALANLIGKLKGKSALFLRKEYQQEIKTKLWGSQLWSPSYWAVSCWLSTACNGEKNLLNNKENQPKPLKLQAQLEWLNPRVYPADPPLKKWKCARCLFKFNS